MYTLVHLYTLDRDKPVKYRVPLPGLVVRAFAFGAG